jgi:hypothetical protein
MHVASVEKSYLENLNARLFALFCPWRRRMKSGPAGKRGRPEVCRKSSSAYHGVAAGALDTLEAFPSGVSALALRVAGGWQEEACRLRGFETLHVRPADFPRNLFRREPQIFE